MVLVNEKLCISFYDEFDFLIDGVSLQYSNAENEEFILENKLVYEKFMNKSLSDSSIENIVNIELWKGVGCIATYSFNGNLFIIQSARWEDDFEVTISSKKYPNLFSKLFNQNSYLDQIDSLRNFSEIIFNAIKSELNPATLSVFLTSSPKNEADDIILLR